MGLGEYKSDPFPKKSNMSNDTPKRPKIIAPLRKRVPAVAIIEDEVGESDGDNEELDGEIGTEDDILKDDGEGFDFENEEESEDENEGEPEIKFKPKLKFKPKRRGGVIAPNLVWSRWIPSDQAAHEAILRQEANMKKETELIRKAKRTKDWEPIQDLPDYEVTTVPMLNAVIKASGRFLLRDLISICPSTDSAVVLMSILYWLDLRDDLTHTRTRKPHILHKTRAQILTDLGLYPRKALKTRKSKVGTLLKKLREAGFISTRIKGQGRGKRTEIMVMVENIVDAIRQDIDPERVKTLGKRCRDGQKAIEAPPHADDFD